MATLTPLSNAINHGTYAMADVLTVLQLAGELDASGNGESFYGSVISEVSGGSVTSITIAFGGSAALELHDISINLAALRQAVETADEGAGSPALLNALFGGMDIDADFSGLAAPVLECYGVGGDDRFTLSQHDDTVSLDGGIDVVDMGAGNDRIFSWNGTFADDGTTSLDGGAGTDTFVVWGLAGTPSGQRIDLQKAFTVDTGDDAYTVKLKNVECITGSNLNETLLGSTKANDLRGMNGDDIIVGRAGADHLTGGEGMDDFVYLRTRDSGPGNKSDIIIGFESGVDDIDLSAIHPDTKNDRFVFIGETGFTGKAGQLRFMQRDREGDESDVTLVLADTDGDRKADLLIGLLGLVELTKDDFVL